MIWLTINCDIYNITIGMVKVDGISGDFMREEYNVRELNPRKNPYANCLKKQMINIDSSTVDNPPQKDSNILTVMK